ncbi:DAGAT-domain-containing protein [Daldinia vernicosa]|uniref:DAGAT-domain-containing protein n=1 Tax=Daldinia vernicosa TaxID=114800 RepID=UPI00200766A6|nr:DAGAT-domain-containing protein [Daldinia vernicosa]KAI0847587.1 DAGAT-domain-containing protein [Daldinia vernicosa]
MADSKPESPQSQEPHGSSRSSKLPRLGQRRHQDQIQTADSDSKPGYEKNNPTNIPTHDIKSVYSKERKPRRISGSSSIPIHDCLDIPRPRTPPRTTKTTTGKIHTPRVTNDGTPHPSSLGNSSSSYRDSPSAARAVLPGPGSATSIPRAFASQGSPPHQAPRRKDIKARDIPKMDNTSNKERPANGRTSTQDVPGAEPTRLEPQKPNSEDEAQSDDRDESGEKYGSSGLDRSIYSTEEDYETPVNGLETTADGDKIDGASYASALKSGLNGQDTDIVTYKRSLNPQDDYDSYPELDDLTMDEIHPLPRPSANGGIRWAPWNVPWKRRMQTFVVLMHCMSIALTVSIFFALCANPFAWPLLLVYLLHVLSSKAATDGSLRYRSEWFRKSYIWHLFAGYFPAKLHKTHDLPPTRKYIFGYHPHGIISHGAMAALGTEALRFSKKFPGITNSVLTLDSNFRIPLYREYILALGLRSVSKDSIVNILTKGGPNGEGMGRAVTIVIGGARESLEAQPGQMRLILKERKGFVRIAVKTGADLVPVLAFGENNLYDQLHPKEHPLVHKLQMFVLKVWKFTLPFLHGRGIFNYDVGLMPYRRPLNVVVGAPIKVTQSAVVDQAEVDRLHDLYITELEKLWDQYKDRFAPDRKEEMQILS